MLEALAIRQSIVSAGKVSGDSRKILDLEDPAPEVSFAGSARQRWTSARIHITWKDTNHQSKRHCHCRNCCAPAGCFARLWNYHGTKADKPDWRFTDHC